MAWQEKNFKLPSKLYLKLWGEQGGNRGYLFTLSMSHLIIDLREIR